MRYVFLCVLALTLSCKEGRDTETVQQRPTEDATLDPVKEHFLKMEQNALKETYKGIFSEHQGYSDLFPIKATNVSTQPIVDAAKGFLEKLTAAQLKSTTFSIDNEEWRKWSNVDNGIYDRQGISLKAMNAEQKEAAFHLMQTSLSAKGLQLSRDIMKTDQTLRELNNDLADYDEELYFFTIMGQPSQTEPWGWQLDGHHLVINYFVLGDQIVMSPVFMGAEPVLTTSGKYEGNTLFQDEQNLGLSFMLSLADDEQQMAEISNIKKGNNIAAEANKDNLTLNYEGLNVGRLSESKKEKLLELIFQYISNIREGHQQIKMEEILEYWDETWFAWVGETNEDAVFYYRIHSPVVLIEFDHQIAVGVPNSDHKNPTRNHIHTIVRTPNGNDYGKDLLKQHIEKHHQK
ncbi:DUF3500 domain-containing protein [Muricauda sp. MAR_2010_75]|uniref:DUF3500 domain-containing protein n=1 Tax=Allomuricauda sp. MAR_2010_75 TaxID=1250232 RepID=UPI00056D8EB8|nr:DUF3500 domain-containing protein [Muricauda sp. MAR_2010_75]